MVATAASAGVDAQFIAALEPEESAASHETTCSGVMELSVDIEKTEQGFGIYFTKQRAPDGESDLLVLDGFVEAAAGHQQGGSGSDAASDALNSLRVGDILVCLNGVDCRGQEVAQVLGLLRSAARGRNTLVFKRCAAIGEDAEAVNGTESDGADNTHEADGADGAGKLAIAGVDDSKDALASVTEGLMGALWKVKSKIKAEIEGDEEEQFREQQENEQFEKQWLGEFHELKAHYEEKWETCTYTADEFCGLLYRSSDAQQKAQLLQEYPTLMDAWKDNKTGATSSRVIPEWPAVQVAYESPVVYQSYPSNRAPPRMETATAAPRVIQCTHSLQGVLACLTAEFMWRTGDVCAFSLQLERRGISSCSQLLSAMSSRTRRFERCFQSREYPRLSKTMLRALRSRAESAAATHEALHQQHPGQTQVASAAYKSTFALPGLQSA